MDADASAAADRFDEEREADFGGFVTCFFEAARRLECARDDRYAGGFGGYTGGEFIAHQVDDFGGWSDECDVGFGAEAGEVFVF